ncbi:DUF222 domain-containing protein [Mycolicibacterium sp. S2-37]|uniref:HNH endonuclease signature motif containing protein n=1 Tax=Mycolicibacterium sp. S2-37 TaxID=2810297 RepID=UPI001A93B227|nr:HNH endonuclease signature motif containing protein [Mycolicibacterium sp. S2-37]MBO0679277.1 DUF222 domain-containing protein [Mycolicibacterium sp. S2-37]
MFDLLELPDRELSGGAAVAQWTRVENASAARRLCAIAGVLERRLSSVDAAEREQWCLDTWAAVSAEIAAAMGVTLGAASHQVVVAKALVDRLPRVAEVFAVGAVSYRLVNAIVFRTALVKNEDAMAKLDTELAAHIAGWGSLSAARLDGAIDYWIDRYDTYALRRTEIAARHRHVNFHVADGSGVGTVWGSLLAHDAVTLDRRLDAMARAVCDSDGRDLEQRRADALGVLGAGGDQLACGCGQPDCAAAGTDPSAVIIHVIAEEDSLTDGSDAQLDGAEPARPTAAKPLREQTIGEAFWQPAPNGPTDAAPAVIVGHGLLPAPMLAVVAPRALVRRIVHPGSSPAEPGYRPSTKLDEFVRCRDVTCRFPNCDVPAWACDIDHTISYPSGPTQAANLKCLCRTHHLLKTFWGAPDAWRDEQRPDATVIWTSPDGLIHTTEPGSRLQFPSLCRPTAPVVARGSPTAAVGWTMPKRARTREQHRAARIDAERLANVADLHRSTTPTPPTTPAPIVPHAGRRAPPAGLGDPPPF